MSEGATETKFIRKERDHLDVLQRRLDWLTEDRPGRKADPSYIPGEAGALSWVLSVLTTSMEPVEVRMERVERHVKVLYSRLGRVEAALVEEDEDS